MGRSTHKPRFGPVMGQTEGEVPQPIYRCSQSLTSDPIHWQVSRSKLMPPSADKPVGSARK
jgi:hypothetical protein